jgi:hypothetical protein
VKIWKPLENAVRMKVVNFRNITNKHFFFLTVFWLNASIYAYIYYRIYFIFTLLLYHTCISCVLYAWHLRYQIKMQGVSICIVFCIQTAVKIPVFIIVQFENFFMNNIKNCHKLRIVINEVHYKGIKCLSVFFSSINDLYLITVLYYTLYILFPP